MHGRNVDRLNISYIDDTPGAHYVWTRHGEQGATWHKGAAQISSSTPYQVSLLIL